jgi:glycerol dehydrogenase-like iron-containing ADH family enzyme
LLKELQLPTTLADLGIVTNINNKIELIAKEVDIPEESKESLNFEVSSELIKKAIIKADKLGRSIA